MNGLVTTLAALSALYLIVSFTNAYRYWPHRLRHFPHPTAKLILEVIALLILIFAFTFGQEGGLH